MSSVGEGKVIIRIRDFLKTNPRAEINTIASEIDSNWATVKNQIRILAELGNVKEERINGHKYFSWVGEYSASASNVLFGLNVDDDESKLMEWIYSRIGDKCEKTFKRTPAKTISQKIAVGVIEDCGLAVPVGWYLYGEISVVMPTDLISSDTNLPNKYLDQKSEINKCIDKWVNVYGGLTPYEAEKRQYELKDKQLYNLKYGLLHDLYNCKHTESSFRDNLFRFAMQVKTPRDDVRDLVNAFVDLGVVLVDKKPDKKVVEEVREKLISSFNEVWRCVALGEFYNDLLNGDYYTKAELDARLGGKMDAYVDDACQNVALLNELLPLGTENDRLRKFKGISKGREPSKSREQLFEDFKTGKAA